MLRNINLNHWNVFTRYLNLSNKTNCVSLHYNSIYVTNVEAVRKYQKFVLNSTNSSHTSLLLKRNMASENTTNVGIRQKHTNRLAKSKSPYLLQHAHNPVDWYPWGNEAIEKARRENKLIFLSVGYSTCHWCHVMERESFENEAVAAIMNEHFVNIKVDREERPDIDKIYMNYLLMRNGSGGWPMSVWITPDLAPIAAGTYFPPKDRWGMPSFQTVLESIVSKWNTDPEQLKSAGLEVISLIEKSVNEKSTDAPLTMDDADEKLSEALEIYKKRFDTIYGGFGSKPKFPEVPRINLLFHAYIITKDIEVLNIALHTLRNIANGGIHDHIFGGFSRYAVDNNWHVPHFEKMLYDQGQLLSAYSNAYKITGDKQFLTCAERIFNYLYTDLRHKEGGFYAGEDADSLPSFEDTTKVEGAFYAWNWNEIEEIALKNEPVYGDINARKSFEIYAYHYGLKPEGNVKPSSDPHSHLKNKNILIINTSEEDTINKFKITNEQLQTILNSTNKLLHEVRKLRPRPHLDTKIICAWNGLVLSGLAKLATSGSTNGKQHSEAGTALISFVKNNMFDEKNGQLVRLWYGNGEDKNNATDKSEIVSGFLDDYAFWIKGLLDFYKVSLDYSILKWAKQLQDTQDKLFWDETNGAYFYSEANSSNVIVRLKEDHDGAEPCGNSVAAYNLLVLAHYFEEANYRQKVSKLFDYFSDQEPFGYALPEMMSALLLQEHGLDLVAIVGPASETTQQFLEICQKFYVPGMVVIRVDPNNTDGIHSKKMEEKFKMVNNMPTVYICHNKICRMPIVDPEKLNTAFMDNYFNALQSKLK